MGDERQPVRHRPLLELATKQHGVVATRQLKALGYTRSSAAKAAKVGRLKRLYRGVYAVGHTDLSWEGNCLAVLLACAPAVASHWSAAWLLDLLRSRRESVHITAPTKRRSRSGIRVHSATLLDEDIGEIEAIPVTSLERTHLDIAARWPDALPDMLDRSEKSKRFDLRKFDSLLDRTSGHPGHGPLQKALRAYRPEPVVLRSNFERNFRDFIRASSLPVPSHNHNVGPYELDCYWPEQRFCVELDTFGTHGSRRSFEEDRKRQRELRKLGVEVERVTDIQLEREPQEVLAAIRRALGL